MLRLIGVAVTIIIIMVACVIINQVSWLVGG